MLRDVIENALDELEPDKRQFILDDMFSIINRIMDKKTIGLLVDKCYRGCGREMYRYSL